MALYHARHHIYVPDITTCWIVWYAYILNHFESQLIIPNIFLLSLRE